MNLRVIGIASLKGLLSVIKPNSPPSFSIARRVHIRAGNVRVGNTLLGAQLSLFSPSSLPSCGATFALQGPAVATGNTSLTLLLAHEVASCVARKRLRRAKLFKCCHHVAKRSYCRKESTLYSDSLTVYLFYCVKFIYH